MDDFELIDEKPYKFELCLRGSEEENSNHIKIKLIVEMPQGYP